MRKPSRVEHIQSTINSRNAFIIFCAGIFAGRFIILLSQFPAYVGGDSISYRPIGVMPDSIPSLAYWPEVLWGKGTRGLLPVAFFGIFPTDDLRMFSQSLISLFSWVFLGLVFRKLHSNLILGNYLYWSLLCATLLFSLTSEITAWNKLIYSESLAISFFVLNFAIFLHLFFINEKRRVYLVNWLLTSFLIITARPNFILFFLVVLCFLFITNYENFWRRKLTFILVFICVILSITYEKSNSDYWTEHNWSHELIAISYYASDDNPHANSFFPIVNQSPNKPKCVPDILSPLPSDQQLNWSLPFNFKGTCLEAREWGKNAFLPILFNWWGQSPIDALDTYRRALIAATRQLPLFEQVVPIPSSINALIYPSVNSQVILPDSYHSGSDRQAKITFDPIFLHFYLLFMISFFRKRQTYQKALPPKIIHFQRILKVYILASICMLLSGILLTPGPQREVYRHAVLPIASLRLATLMLLVIGGTLFIQNLRERPKKH